MKKLAPFAGITLIEGFVAVGAGETGAVEGVLPGL
jgi:hypothetical protein